MRTPILKTYSEAEGAALFWNWKFWARNDQLRPGTPRAPSQRDDWNYWMVQAGRGYGKTRTGAEFVRDCIDQGYRRGHLVGPTASDVRDVMVQGPSGLLNCFPPHQRPLYEPSKRLITFHTGAVAVTFSADEPARLRGPQCDFFWGDEISYWRFGEDAWDNLQFGFRLGDDPRGIITTTPRPTKLFKSIIEDPITVVTRGSTYDNRGNLAKAFFKSIIRKYEGTRLGRQELEAELLDDNPGALWTRAMIENHRARLNQVPRENIIRIVVAIDPAVSAGEDSADTGIVVAGLTRSGHILVLDDRTCHESPAKWAQIAISAFQLHGADRIIGEINNGGDLVEANLRACNPNIPFRQVRASRGKAVRAEPVAALYEQGRVYHVGTFPQLEDQMCLASGSLVLTMRGHIPIQNVLIGDMVLTRIGWCRVKASGQTGVSRLVTIKTTGSLLRCTSGHLLWSNGTFRPCFEVQKGSILLTCQSRSRTHLSIFAERNITATLATATSKRADIVGGYCSIDQSGRRRMVQSRSDGMFTTSTTTEETILSPTYKRFHQKITSGSMARPVPGQFQQSKDPLKLKPLGQRGSQGKLNARSVENPAWSKASDHVFAESIVESVIVSGYPEPVYNLSVEEQPEFFANGILVHNCLFVPGAEVGRLDRMDALVWAITELVIDPEVMTTRLTLPHVSQISPI